MSFIFKSCGEQVHANVMQTRSILRASFTFRPMPSFEVRRGQMFKYNVFSIAFCCIRGCAIVNPFYNKLIIMMISDKT